MDETGVYVLAGLLALNVWAFLAFGLDKWRSRGKRRRRTSERRLLTHAVLGGFPGAKLGQHFFRHKTTKQPFARRLNRIGWGQGVLVVGLLGYGVVTGAVPWL